MSIKSALFGTAAALVLSSAVLAQTAPAQPNQQQQPQRPATTTAPAAQPQAPAARPATAPAPTAPAPATTAPKAATPAPAPAAPAATAPRPATAPAQQGTLVNLNTAPENELDKLPQIGPARAKAIIEARTKGGRFKDWNDFVARGVVPSNAEAAIKDKVRF
jgi:DNA uptake protein ComE-like DNA-binding protein